MEMESIKKGEPKSLKAHLGSDLHPKKRQKSQVVQNQNTGKMNSPSKNLQRLMGSALDCQSSEEDYIILR